MTIPSEHTVKQVERMVAEEGSAFVAENVMSAFELFLLANRHGWSFMIGTRLQRNRGEHPLVTKDESTFYITQLVAENRELKAQLAAANRRTEENSR